MEILSREVPLTPGKSVLLIIDVQNYCCLKKGGEYQGMNQEQLKRYDYFFQELSKKVFPNIFSGNFHMLSQY